MKMRDKLEISGVGVLTVAGAIALATYGNGVAGGEERRVEKYPGSFDSEWVTWHVHAHPVAGGFLLALGILAAVTAAIWTIVVVLR